ncbi:MAG: siderophore-interacting protein [Streptosporangiales bacterium]|nr:siderophore-interacting protein [Streptosporangiales bacterium]
MPRPEGLAPVTTTEQQEVLPYVHVACRVARTRELTPHMLRVTFDGLDGAAAGAGDQRIKIFFPLAGQECPEVPTGTDWYKEYLAMPAEVKPVMRTYTIRSLRSDVGEMDVDFVRHGDSGPASAWCERATAGDRVTMWVPNAHFGAVAGGYEYKPPAGADWQLLAGDETALPAIAGILEDLAPGTSARLFVEVPDDADRQDMPTAGDVRVTWLSRAAYTGGDSPLVAAVRSADLPAGTPYAWLAGEASAVRDLRRHLVRERGVDKRAIDFCGYWRRGKTEDEPLDAAEEAAVLAEASAAE